jgi:BirA family transcriptional regulator, biotin operon repressor / biotin---[acetyl-CoA-carboxylase] ligase
VLLRPSVAPERWPRLTTLAAAAICKAVMTCVPLRPTIKWPNDLHIGTRKVCGLLAETYTSSTGPFLVLGIGLNVNTLNFSIDLHHIATSLLQQMPANIHWIERESLAAAVLKELTLAMACWDEDYNEVLGYVRERSLLLGKSIRAVVNGAPVFGRAVDLNGEGHLILELPDGSSQTLTSAAEVRLVG